MDFLTASKITKAQEEKYTKMLQVLEDQLFKQGPPVFFDKSVNYDDNELYNVREIFAEKVVEFAKGRESLFLQKYKNQDLTLQDVSSECYVCCTKDYQNSFIVVKSHPIRDDDRLSDIDKPFDPNIMVLYALSLVKIDGEYHLLQLGTLWASIKKLGYKDMDTVANISWIGTNDPTLQYCEDILNIEEKGSKERSYAHTLSYMFNKKFKYTLSPENKGIGSTLLEIFDGIANNRGVDYIILDSLIEIEDKRDINGNVVYEKDTITNGDGVDKIQQGAPVKVDVHADIFYNNAGFIKTGLSYENGIYMYKPVRPVYPNKMPENIRDAFQAFNYRVGIEKKSKPDRCNRDDADYTSRPLRLHRNY